MQLTELQGLVGFLVQSLHNAPSELVTSDITRQIIAKQALISEIIKEAETQQKIQASITQEEKEHVKLEGEVNKLQQQLRQSQQALEAVVSVVNEKVEISAKARSKQCSVNELLSYSHLISRSYGTQMPPNWHEGDPRRPFPTDRDMRLGELGKLAIQAGSMEALTGDEAPVGDTTGQAKVGSWKLNRGESVVEYSSLLPVAINPDTMLGSSSEDDDEGMEDVT